jgi:hypothetical protein
MKGIRVLVMVSAAILLAPNVPCAAATREGIAGWEGDGFDQGYGFAMLGALLPKTERLSFPVRLTGSYLYYNFEEAGETVKVKAPGGAVQFGVRTTRDWGVVTALLGGDLRWETRDRETMPRPNSAVARGGVMAQIDGDLRWSKRLHPFWLVNYSGSAHYVYGRAGLRCQVSNLDWRGPLTWAVGVEGIGQGNPDTDAIQAGGTLECTLVRQGLSLSVRGGYKDSASSDQERRQGGYVGAGLYHHF